MTRHPTPDELLCDEIAANAGLDWHDLPSAYMAAVASVLVARGIVVADHFANPDDPRSACISLDHQDIHLIWSAGGGWSYLEGDQDRGELSVGHFLPLPPEIADAVPAITGRTYHCTSETLRARLEAWQPPSDYDFDAVSNEPDEVSPDLDRSLAAYVTHPGYLAYRSADGQAPAQPDITGRPHP